MLNFVRKLSKINLTNPRIMAIYFDNAATTQVDSQVLEAMLPFLQNQFGNPSSIHSAGRQARAAIERTRKFIAKTLNVSASEICFTSCGTEANNTAFMGAVRDLGVKHIISSPTEHHCITHFLEYLEKEHGTHVHYLEVDSKGHINYEQLSQLLGQIEEKTMVSLMHGNNEIGTMIDLERISLMCQEHNALFHSDMVQTYAHFPLDLQATPIHFMSCSAHKFHGPKGVGFLYTNGDIQIKPLLYGGSQERNMRSGTENISGIVGLGKAAELAHEHLEEHSQYVRGLRDYCKNQLLENFEDLQFNGDLEGRSLYTVLNVAFPPDPRLEMLLFNLDIEGICASGGSACSSGVDKGSHVLRAIGADVERPSVRFSFSKNNTKEEIDVLIGVLNKIIKEELVA